MPQRGAGPLLRSVPEPAQRPEPRPSTAPAFRPVRDPNRFELKYWLPEEATEELVRYVSPFVELDEHSRGETQGSLSQCNTSLYLDTPDLGFFNAHTEKAVDRIKLRVRAYGEIPHGKAFFEIKRKANNVILKSRAVVPLELAPTLLDGSYERLPELRASHRRNLERFLYFQEIHRARPLVLVRCFREAYANVAEDIRVTLDRQICYQPALGASFDLDPQAWVPICGEDQHGGTGPHALLELKFPSIAPPWMLGLVRRLQARRQSFSKYCTAVRAMLAQSESEAALWDSASDRST